MVVSLAGKLWLSLARPQVLSFVRLSTVQRLNYSKTTEYSAEQETAINDPGFSKLKRGRGGRSSFNGVVCTVFGSSGFLARNVINQLGKQGTQIIVAYRGDSYDVDRLKLAGDLGQILYCPIHLRDAESLKRAMKYSNVVVNCIGRDFETKNFSYNDVHATGAGLIAKIAKECGVKKLIHISSMNANDNGTGLILKGGSKFLKSKFDGEKEVRKQFPDATIFRPAEMYGQGDRYLNYYAAVWRRELRFLPLWNRGIGIIKQPVYVGDVARGIVNSIFDQNSPGNTYQAVGPRRYELGEFIDWVYLVMRKGAEWGYFRVNMKYMPTFRLRVTFVQKFAPSYPILIWDKMEREHTTDVLDRKLPTLEDLGVQLTYAEDQIPWELKPWRANQSHQEELGEFPDPPPPKVAPA